MLISNYSPLVFKSKPSCFTKEFIFTNLKYLRSPYLIGNNDLKIGEIEKPSVLKSVIHFVKKA